MKIGGSELTIKSVALEIESSASKSWLEMMLGSLRNSLINSFFSRELILETVRAKSSPTATMLVKTLVEATAYSGPACK